MTSLEFLRFREQLIADAYRILAAQPLRQPKPSYDPVFAQKYGDVFAQKKG